MKKVIISAALVLLVSGFTAAQSTSAKQATTKKEKATTVKKGTAPKIDPSKTVLKQETAANAKSDSSVKLVLPVPIFPADSTSLPVVKKDDE